MADWNAQLANRVRTLYRTGFFQLDGDLARVEQEAATAH